MYGYFVDRNYKGNLPYTDLAVERRRADTSLPGIEYRKTNTPLGSYERVKISTKNGADYIGKPLGIYDTLQADRLDRLDSDERMRLSDALADELNKMVEDSDIFPGRLLVAGLGNRRLTPDSLGCEAADRVIATMHLKEFDPMIIQKLGRKVNHFNEDIWAHHRYKIVVRGNIAKFSQNYRLYTHLMDTADKFLSGTSGRETVHAGFEK
jgi:hypothetical protein